MQQPRALLKKSKRAASSARPYTAGTAKKPLAGSTKKQRRPWTTQLDTHTCVPPKSNSASSRVAPSSGDARKKSYLCGGASCVTPLTLNPKPQSSRCQ